ncbi:hypothetical protein JCM11251_004024 [Rhodosporidiobolus azoricus]
MSHNSERRFPSPPLLSYSSDSGDESPSPVAGNDVRSLDACANTFYDDASSLHTQIDSLKSHLDFVRALSARLYALHPNSPETPVLAADLRDALVDGADELKRIDDGLFSLWRDEERVRVAVEAGRYKIKNTSAVGSQEGEIQERRDEVKGLVKRFGRRVREIRREARGEKKDRETDGEEENPLSLVDYLEKGTKEIPKVLTKNTVHASRWVVENPFSILVRLTDNLKSLAVPQMASKKLTPSTYTRPSPPPLFPVSPITFDGGLLHQPFSSSCFRASPKPLGSAPTKPMAGWKADILEQGEEKRRRDGKPSLSHRFYDEIAQDTAEGWKEIKVATGRGHRERWIIFLTLALFPMLFIANLIEHWLGPSSVGSSTSAASSPSSTGKLSMRSLAPTLMAGDLKIGVFVSSSAIPTAGGAGEARLRERRRRSVELDGEVV